MMTSIWYSPYLSTATAIAIGKPASPITVEAVSATAVSTAGQVPAICDVAITTSAQAIMAAAVNAIHLICRRCSRSPDRYRVIMAAVDVASTARNTAHRALIVPITSSGPGSDRTPSGFWTTTETPPGAGRPMDPG